MTGHLSNEDLGKQETDKNLWGIDNDKSLQQTGITITTIDNKLDSNTDGDKDTYTATIK